MFEKVNPCHPDKVADRIAGAIVDLAYTKADNPKIAVEVLLGHGECMVMIETSVIISDSEVDNIVHRIAGDDVVVHKKLASQDIHLAKNQQGAVRCGDNGIFKGCVPTHEQKLLTAIAGSIYDKTPYDGKYLISRHVDDDDPDYEVYKTTICQSHATSSDINRLLEQFENVNFFNKGHQSPIDVYEINPLGKWTGGLDVDCGATNRKLGSDMGDGVTGGGLHGKDLSKADVSVNIWCYLESIRTGHEITAYCSIGDEEVNGVKYTEIVEQARQYIHSIGGFEKFAEWGLIRP